MAPWTRGLLSPREPPATAGLRPKQNTQTLQGLQQEPRQRLAQLTVPAMPVIRLPHGYATAPPETPALREQLPTPGFSLFTNTVCIFPRKPMPGQFPHFALTPMVTQRRQRLPFFRTQERSASLLQGTLVSLLPFIPKSFTATLGLTGQQSGSQK